MIAALSVLISCVGIGLFAVLICRIREVENSVKLKRHRSKEAGVADLLNYAAVIDDGIIACKNGSLMAAWIYTGDDNASRTDAERERVSAVINTALAGLGDGWMIHVDAVRRAAPSYIPQGLSHFPDKVTAAIEEERRRFFESLGTMYEGFFVLTVTYFPPLLAQAKFVELMFDDDNAPASPTGRYQKLLETFKKDIATLESRLSSVFRMDRLQSRCCVREDGAEILYDDFLQFLQLCITGIRQPMQLPKHPVCLDALLGGQELYGGVIPKIGNKFMQVVAIEGFPPESYPGMLSVLTDFDVEYRWSNRFIFLDQHTATSHMDSYRKKWRQKQRGIIDHIFHLNTVPDADAVSMTQDAETAIAEVKSGLVGMGYYTSVIVLMDEDRDVLEMAGHKLEKAIFNLGFAARIETINTLDAYFGSLPGHGHENVRRPLMNSLNLADLLPSSSIWTGLDYAPSPLFPPNSPPLLYGVTTGHSPFRFNLHVRDLGHTLMFGPTGAGKSTALGLFAAQFLRYGFDDPEQNPPRNDTSVFVFDKGMSMYTLTTACGGKHFSVASDSTLQFAPLSHLRTRRERAWVLEWLDTILALNRKERTTPGQRAEIASTLKIMSETGGSTLTDFVAAVQDQEIREIFSQYTIDGPMGALLDSEAEELEFSRLTTFEVEELMNLGERWSLPVLLYLFWRIETALHGHPVLIVLDEAWLLLANPAFSEKIREWFKVLRKRNAAVLMATQNLSDAANSSIFDVILESSATKIFLPNVHARGEFSGMYRKMGLNEQQIDLIASATPKREYYLVSEKGCRKFSFAIGPLAMAFVGVSDKETVTHVQSLQKQHGDDWVEVWLNSKGLSLTTYGAAS